MVPPLSTTDNRVPCLRCARTFKTRSEVLNHMNQPNSHCRLLPLDTPVDPTGASTAGIAATTSNHSTTPAPAHLSDDDDFDVLSVPSDNDSMAVDRNCEAEEDSRHSEMEDDPMEVDNWSNPDSELVQTDNDMDNTNARPEPFYVETYPGAACTTGNGPTFMDLFDKDQFTKERTSNTYYPFATRKEWELAAFLLKSKLSMAAIDEFLKLELVSFFQYSQHNCLSFWFLQIKDAHLSFSTAKDLRSRAEVLPVGPKWMSKRVETPIPTKKPIELFYRNPVDCLQALLRNPLLKDHISFSPFRLYESAAKVMRTYTEWLSGDAAWYMQVNIEWILQRVTNVHSTSKHFLLARRPLERLYPVTRQPFQ